MLCRSMLHRNNRRQWAFEKTLGLVWFSKVKGHQARWPELSPHHTTAVLWPPGVLCGCTHTCACKRAHTHTQCKTNFKEKVLKEMTILWILCSNIFPLKNKDKIKTFLLRQKHVASHHRLSMVKHPTALDSSTQEGKAGGLSSKWAWIVQWDPTQNKL